MPEGASLFRQIRQDAVAPDAVSAVTTPKSQVPKRIKKDRLSEPKASFRAFPFWYLVFWGPRRGGVARSPFFAYFWAAGQARSKKSERLPGRPRLGRLCLGYKQREAIEQKHSAKV
jgi:hypothetical protein